MAKDDILAQILIISLFMTCTTHVDNTFGFVEIPAIGLMHVPSPIPHMQITRSVLFYHYSSVEYSFMGVN